MSDITTAITEGDEAVEMFDAHIPRVDAVAGPASGLRFAVLKAEGDQPEPDPSLVEKADDPTADEPPVDDSDGAETDEKDADKPVEKSDVLPEPELDPEPVEKASFAPEDVGAAVVSDEIVPGATEIVAVGEEPVVKVEGPMSGTLDQVFAQAGMDGETPIEKAQRLARAPMTVEKATTVTTTREHYPFPAPGGPAGLGNGDEVFAAATALVEKAAAEAPPADTRSLLGIAKQSTPGTPTEPAPEPEFLVVKDEAAMVPSSAAWEKEDADKAKTATEALVELRGLVETLTTREGVEVAAGDEDPTDLMNLSQVCEAIDFALTVMARFAIDEEAETAEPAAVEAAEESGMSDLVAPEEGDVEKAALALTYAAAAALGDLGLDGTIEVDGTVEKVGKKISANTEAQLRSAMTAIQAVLEEQKANTEPAPDGTAAEAEVNAANEKEGEDTVKKSEMQSVLEDMVRAARKEDRQVLESLEARVRKAEGMPAERGPALMPGAAAVPVLRDQGPTEDPDLVAVRKQFDETQDPQQKAELGMKLSQLAARERYAGPRIPS